MSLPNELSECLKIDFEGKFELPLLIEKIFPLSGGCINRACRIITNQGIFFLKWNHSGPIDLFVREAESLVELNKSENEFIAFPKPILFRQIDKFPGYLLTDYLEGGITGNDDEKLGRGLASLHKVTSSEFGFCHDNYCGETQQDNSYKSDWEKFYTENRIVYLINKIKNSRGWSVSDSELAERFLLKAGELLSHNPKPSLIHGDLWAGNYIYTIKGPALIDPAASYCDREFEMGIMTMFGGFSKRVYDSYNEIFPLPYNWKERNLIYQLYHVLNHYYLFGGFYKNQAMDIMKHYS